VYLDLDIGDSIGATWSLEGLACGSVVIETEVNGVTKIWSSAQRKGDQVCATRLTIPNS
jgi:hypothetical protein